MTNMFRTVSVGMVLAIVMLAASGAQAAGFALYEASAKGNVMGGAVVGRTDDASAVQANPANMSDNPGFQSMVGVTAVGPAGKIKTPLGDTKLKDQWFILPHAYATWEVFGQESNIPKDQFNMWLGAGLYSEFGMGTHYTSTWPGRYNSLETKLETMTLSPTVSFKFFDKLSIGTGFRAMYADFFNDRLVRNPGMPAMPLGRMSVKGDGWGFGWLLGAKYEVLDNLDIGVVYRSRVRMHLDGVGRFEAAPGVPLPNAGANADAAVILPSSATIGSNYRLLENRLNLGIAVTWTEWSTYDSLNINFANPGILGATRSESEKDWDDAWRFGFGASYNITERLSAMAGYVYDLCPINPHHTDFMMPNGNRHIFGIGLGYAFDNYFINVGYNYIINVETTRIIDNGGVPIRANFDSMDANLFALSLGTSF